MTEKLTRRKLDAAVAERVMGATIVRLKTPSGVDEIGVREPEFAEPFEGGANEFFPAGRLTNPSTCVLAYFSESIEAAMQVVEKMRERDKDLEVEMHTSGDRWFVAFAADRVDGRGYQDIGEGADGETLPLAICHAALAAVGSSRND